MRLTLFGHFRLSGPRGDIDLGSRKLSGLVAFLACTGPQPQTRDRLATLFWGSHFDAQAKQNLRQALSRLRKLLGPDALSSDGETVVLNTAALDCDVGRFEALIGDGGREALRTAADLYRGELIDNIAVNEESWSEWLAAERRRFHELAIGALIELGNQELAAGRAEPALKSAQRAVALNNMREDAHRLVVQALAATGRKAEALRHYQDFVLLLKRELNTAPDAASEALVAELRATQPSRKRPAAAEPKNDLGDGTLTDEAPPTVPAARSAGSERRQLTVLLCAIADAAPLAMGLDPEDMLDRITAFHRGVADAAARFDGFIAQYSSNAVLVYFGYPVAHEHDAERAVRAGFAIVEAIGGLKTSTDARLGASVSIASGLVVVVASPGGQGIGQPIAIGEAPTVAAQLQAAASPGEVVIAASTHRLLGQRFEYRALPAISLNGPLRPVEAWQVRGERPGLGRFEARRAAALSPLVGRQEEINLLRRRWELAKGGEGRVVLLSGEPGIGKSRIAETLLATIAGEPHASLRYFCSPHHAHSPLYPVIAQTERAAGFEPNNDAVAKLDRLEALLAPRTKNPPRDLALFADLLSVPSDGRYPPLNAEPQQKREMTLEAILGILETIAAQSPVLIEFEDAHWSDPTSLDLLERTVARVASLPVLVVVTTRPELQPGWVGQPHVTMLPLSRLDRNDSTAMIAGLTGDKALPEAVIERVLTRADGVPLFIEELTSTLLESGLLRETTNRYVLDRPLPRLAIPTSLQASLVARLDRLGPAKEVAQIGAAIGRHFAHELVVALSASPDLDAKLASLTASGLISRRGTPPDATYSFKHALVQDAAYATLLKSQRRELHARIAAALVERFKTIAETQPEVVAHHFAEAGRAAEAVDCWRRAGSLAVARSANREAVTSFEQALELLATLPETSERLKLGIDLRVELRTALFQLGEFERIADHLREAESLARKLGDQRRLGILSVYLCHNRRMAGHLREAFEFGHNAQAIAATLNDLPLQVTANLDLGAARVFAGDYRQAEELLRKVLGWLKGDQQRERFGQTIFPAVAAHGYLAWILADLGRFQEGIAHGRAALDLAETFNHPYSMAYALWALARPHVVREDFDEAARLLERGMAVSREWNLTFLSILNTGGLGYSYAFSGRVGEGMPLLLQALNGNEAAPEGAMMLPLCMLYLAEANILTDRLDDARDFAARVLALSRERGQRGWQVRALRLVGEIAARRGDQQQAESNYREAITLAEELGFRPVAAHCHLSLARLYGRTGAPALMRERIAAATAIYRDMGTAHWLESAQAEMRRMTEANWTSD